MGDINKGGCGLPAKNVPAPRTVRGAGTFSSAEPAHLLNVFAIIPCTSADDLTIRAMLAAW